MRTYSNILKSILITRPQGDLALKYLELWSKEIIEIAREKSYDVFDLFGSRARKKDLEKIIKKKKPDYIILNGHGNYNLITGQNSETLVEANVNSEILSGSIVYAISCRSAKVLGKEVVKKENSAYLGYLENFIFYYNEKLIFRPLEDDIAKLFLEPSNQLSRAILKNHSAFEALESSKKYFMRNIQKLLSSGNSGKNSQFISALYYNFKNQVCLGDGNLTL